MADTGWQWGDLPWNELEWGGGPSLGAFFQAFIRDSPNTRNLAEVTDARRAQLAGVLWQLAHINDPDKWSGKMLDVCGARLGRARGGMSDPAYRRAIKAAAVSRLPELGPDERVIKTWEAWTTFPVSTYYTNGPAVVQIWGRVPAGSESVLYELVRAAAPAGVSVVCHTYINAGNNDACYETLADTSGSGVCCYTTTEDEPGAALAVHTHTV